MRFILIIALFTLTSFNISQDIRQDIRNIVNKIEAYNILEHEHVGIVGVTTVQYHNFIKLKNTAKISELLSLLKYKNSAVKGYASWALADRKYPAVDEILSNFLDTGEKVTSRNGCERSKIDLASEFYYRVFYQNFNKKVSINDSLFLLRSIEKMDSVILYRDKYSALLDNALENNNSNPRTYERIKELSVIKGLPSAIVALAKYKRKEDIQTIIIWIFR